MASTVLVRHALWQASGLLTDDKPQFQRWAEVSMVQFANDAQLAIAKYLPTACSRVDAIKLRAGTLQSIESIAAADCKPGDGSTPAAPVLGMTLLHPICDMGADGLTPGRALRIVDRKAMDAVSPTWPADLATVPTSIVYDPATPRYFHAVPGPKEPRWARIAYTAQPVKIPAGGPRGSEIYAYAGSSAVTLSVSDEHAEDVVNYIVARCNMMNAEWADGAKAAAFAQLFLGSLNGKVAASTGTNPNLKRLPFAPEPVARAA